MSQMLRRGLLSESVLKNITPLTSTRTLTTQTQDVVIGKSPPGPKQLPLIGSLKSILSHKAYDSERMHLFWHELYKEYGPVYQLRSPGASTNYFLHGIEDIEKFFKVTFDNPVRPMFETHTVSNRRCPSKFYKEGEYGILCEQGDNWWRVRRLVQPFAMKLGTVSLYLPGMDQLSSEFIERMVNKRDDKLELPEDFAEYLMEWSLENIGLICFNKNISKHEEGPVLLKTGKVILKSTGQLEYGAQLWRHIQTPNMYKLMKGRDIFRQEIMKSVTLAQESLRKEDKSKKDMNIMEQLLITPGLSYRDVVMFMMDFTMASIDTTAYAICFTLYLLSVNPEKQLKLQVELDEVLGDKTEHLTPSHLAKLTYTKAVVKEVLRMYPVTMGVARTLQNDEVFSGYKIPKGSVVRALEYANCYSEELFYKPKEFLPERWLRHRPYGDIHKWACFSFSRGTRSCIGRRVSEQEMYTLIARLFHKYTLEWNYESLNPKTHLFLHPDLPLKFAVKERAMKDL